MTRRRTSHRAIAIAIALSLAAPIAARGEVRIEGNPAAMHITAGRESIANVLAALRTTFDVQHRSAVALDVPANPTYAGPLERVIASLLDGFDYVVKRSQGRTEIIVLGRHGAAAVPSPAPKPAPTTGILSRWR